MTTELLAQLRAIVGDANVLTEGDLSAYEQDWRKRVRGHALAVVRPANTREVAGVVKACSDAGISLVPQGGNTGLSVGSVPDESKTQVVLTLQRMNAIRTIDAANLTITVDAGCILQSLQETAEKAGFLFPLSLAAEGSCTIGGNLATNAGGTQVLRYGNARDLCLGLELVTSHGDVWDGLSGLRKDNTGYDLRDLMIGSEGTLGIITGATLKLFPLPAASLTAWALVSGMDQAIALLGLAQKHLSSGLTGFEVMGQFAISLVAKHFPTIRIPFADILASSNGNSDTEQEQWSVLLELSDSESEEHARARFEALMETAFEQGLILDAVVAENITQANQLWHVRESIPLAQAEEGLNIKHDVSVPISRMGEFVKDTDAILVKEIPGVRLVNFGHLGDGNLHYNVQAPVEGDPKAFLRDKEDLVNTLVYDSVEKFGGSISAEHGVGSLKVAKLEKHKSPVALSMMRSIKTALDPKGIMNPGRVIRLDPK